MLSGKAAGMQITPGGGPLASTRVVIRGNNSLTGNNQPLYVVDGIPMEANEVGEDGLDYGSPINSINPDEIESMEVLKGANAAALYGSSAANGVILITTKKATKKPGLGVSYGYNMMFGSLYNFPTYQNIYGMGHGTRLNAPAGVNHYDLNNRGWTYQRDLPYGIFIPAAVDGFRSFGLPMLGFDIVGRNGQVRSYSPQPNNVKDMFQTSTAITHSLSLDKVTDESSFRFSYTNIDSDDIIENLNNLNRHIFNVRATAKISNIIDVDANARYMYEAVDHRNYRNDNSSKNPFRILMDMPRDVQTAELTPWKRENGSAYSYEGFMNPYWALFEIANADNKHDFVGNVAFNIKLPYNITARLRAATNMNVRQASEFSNLGSGADGGDGYYSTQKETWKNNNGDFLLDYSDRYGDNVSLSASLGATIQHQHSESERAWVDALKYYDMKSLSNTNGTVSASEGMNQKQKQGVFATASLGLYDWLFFEGTLRNDWSSSLPTKYNSYLYYSVGSSIILTDAFKVDKDAVLTFAKVRASFAEVGNDTGFDQLRAKFTKPSTQYLGNSYFQGEATRPQPELRPETTRSFEVGTDLRFFDNRLSVDFTYYNKSTIDQILSAEVSRPSGYNNSIINSGEVRNRGVELSLSYTPFRTNMFSWTTTFNGASNKTKIISMPGGQLLRGNGENGLRTASFVGQPFAVFYGTDFKYTDDGRVMVQKDGRAVEDPELRILGTVEPEMIGGWINSFRLGQFDFGAMMDFQVGGHVWSQTSMRGGINGQTVQSLAGRLERLWSEQVLGENGEERQGFLNPNNTVLPGSTLTPTTDNPKYVLYPDWERPKGLQLGNAVYDSSVDYFGKQFNDLNGNGINDGGAEQIWMENYAWVNPDDHWTHGGKRNLNYIYDASYIKVRELSVGYNVPTVWLRNTPLRTVRLSAVARNMAILYQGTPRGMDPQATSNTGNDQGLEKGFNLPQANYGFDIKVTF
jgi:TonB-linked SusC/RagA family outer membrane protein